MRVGHCVTEIEIALLCNLTPFDLAYIYKPRTRLSHLQCTEMGFFFSLFVARFMQRAKVKILPPYGSIVFEMECLLAVLYTSHWLHIGVIHSEPPRRARVRMQGFDLLTPPHQPPMCL